MFCTCTQFPFFLFKMFLIPFCHSKHVLYPYIVFLSEYVLFPYCTHTHSFVIARFRHLSWSKSKGFFLPKKESSRVLKLRSHVRIFFLPTLCFPIPRLLGPTSTTVEKISSLASEIKTWKPCSVALPRQPFGQPFCPHTLRQHCTFPYGFYSL